MTNRNLIITIVVILLIAAGVVFGYNWQQSRERTKGLSMPDTTEQSGQPADQQNPATSSPETAQDCKRDFNADTLKTAKVDIANRQVQFDVKDFGKFTVELYDKDAPKTVENFLRLTNSGYYNCLTFHRVAKGFVIQGGDPTGTGSGGNSAFGGEFADELNANTASYKAGYVKGVLAMANRGANTNTSQFFVMLGDVPLPHDYTIFGKVTIGQDVVDRIGQVDITPVLGPTDGTPKKPVVMQKVSIVK